MNIHVHISDSLDSKANFQKKVASTELFRKN